MRVLAAAKEVGGADRTDTFKVGPETRPISATLVISYSEGAPDPILDPAPQSQLRTEYLSKLPVCSKPQELPISPGIKSKVLGMVLSTATIPTSAH